ncbi:glycosyltransferase family 2 protein [Gryllotalpicola kribbensis]|jgi:undecaprenyl-phosphate 4-deoxy-4-formamido-L-arabinose transferase|uniref:Glycosyltransferase family 2 protein n=1 Tax=Gryllotalpicola kribbensis TaxID=993084 RepID=A0ABP8AQ86_9MICO
MEQPSDERPYLHTVSVVIPVYGGEHTLAPLTEELVPLTEESVTPDGNHFVVSEVLFSYDNGRDDSARVIRELEGKHPFARAIWLSRNYGQHAATLAGMSSSAGDWIVTLDEDGQHDPADIAGMLDTALREQAPLVYSKPVNEAPHGFLRNLASKSAKALISLLLGSANAKNYQSFRLVVGSIGRSVAAYAGSGVYLDVALSWIVSSTATSPTTLRQEGAGRQSGYSLRRLLSHFWRLVISNGTRGLRIVSYIGVLFAAFGIALTIWVLIATAAGNNTPPGWASTTIIVTITSGAILFSLGVIAEYIGVSVNMAMGKPLYLITTDPADGPMGKALPGSRR